MKLLSLLACILLSSWVNMTLAHTNEEYQEARFGLHGMLLFSDGVSLYASHLPMFHKPHDVQLITRFELKDKIAQDKLQKSLVSGGTYWTLSPDRFDLNFLGLNSVKGIWQFGADLYLGHFERSAKRIFSNQTVIIKEVILKERLDEMRQSHVEYIRLAPDNVKRQFYARLIKGRPGVDHLFWVHSSRPLVKRFTMTHDEQRSGNTKIALKLGVKNSDLSTYYEERGDLE